MYVIKAFKTWPLYFLSYLGFLKGKEIEYCLRNGVKLLVPEDPHSRFPMAEIWIYKTYTPSGFTINKKDTVVDIGANIGVFSVYAAKKATQGKIYAYEPLPENFKLLNHNIKLNSLSNVTPLNLAVSGSKDREKIYLTDSSISSSLFGQRGQQFHPVKSVGLKDVFEDSGLREINFLKMDCEGSEYNILFNTPKKYLDKIDKVVLEYHEGEFTKYKGKDLEKFFQNHNFKVIAKPERNTPRGMLYARKK